MRNTRRQFLATTLAAGSALALAACGYRGEEGAGRGWSYTDDRGRKAETDGRPKRVVAQVTAAAALWDLGVRSVGIFGPSKLPNGKRDPQAGRVDVANVTSLGNVWGEFNYDKYVSLNPDLMVSVMYTNNELWYVPKQQAKDIERVAPTIGIDLEKLAAPTCIQKFEKLAGALGADLEAGSLRAAKAKFEKADAEFAKVAKQTSGKRVMAMSAQQDKFYVANPSIFPTTKHFQDQGMNLVVPKNVDEHGYYEELSWENAGRYPADIIMYDNRFSSVKPDQLRDNPTWSRLPAVRAGRLIPWDSEPPFSHRYWAGLLSTLTAQLSRAAEA